MSISVQIGEIVSSMESGFACAKSKLVDSGLPHLRPFNVGMHGHIDEEEMYFVPPSVAPASKRRIEAGDLLFNNTNSRELVGKVAYVEQSMDAGFSNHITRIRVDRSKAEPAFVAFALRRMWSQGFFRENCKQWVSQAGFGPTELAKVMLNLPSLEEQRRVVDILNRAASIERLRAQATTQLRDLIPALFIKMFGDPIDNPMGWDVKPLAQMCAIDSDLRVPDVTTEANHLCIGPDSIEKSTGQWLKKTTVADVAPRSGKYRFKERDVLYSKIRPALQKCVLADSSGFCSADMYPLRCNDDVDPAFLWMLLLTDAFTSYAVGSSTRAQMPKVNRTTLFAYQAICPPIEIQREFGALADQIAGTHKIILSSSERAADLSASLANKMFGSQSDTQASAGSRDEPEEV